MIPVFSPLRGLTMSALMMRMFLSLLCGTVIGLERSAKNRPAGFRTHILVCLSSCVSATTGLYIYLVLRLPSDVSRIATQVISGLGFIGAGTIIITKKLSIKGLTTAAGLWTCGIIGLAVGSGYYEAGLIGTILVLITETFFGRLGALIQQSPEYTLELLYKEKTSIDHVLRFCKDNSMSITNIRIQTHSEPEVAKYAAKIDLRGNAKLSMLIDSIQIMPGIVSVVSL